MTILVSFQDNTIQLTTRELSPTHQTQAQMIPNTTNPALSQNPSNAQIPTEQQQPE